MVWREISLAQDQQPRGHVVLGRKKPTTFHGCHFLRWLVSRSKAFLVSASWMLITVAESAELLLPSFLLSLLWCAPPETYEIHEHFMDELVCLSLLDPAFAEIAGFHPLRRSHVPRQEGYSEVTVPQQSDRDFRGLFRLSRGTFDIVVNRIRNSPHLSSDSYSRGRLAIDIRKQLQLTL